MEAIAGTLGQMETKSEIRRRLLDERRALDSAEAARRSGFVRERLWTLPEFQRAGRVLTYVSAKDNEVDTRAIIERLLAEGRIVACPQSLPDRVLAWRKIDSVDDLTGSRYGIPEPQPERCKVVAPSRADVVLVPGIAFTREGHRIGYGGGYFDRFLHDFGGLSIGLAYEFQLVDAIPTGPHDMRLNLVVTESDVPRSVRD